MGKSKYLLVLVYWVALFLLFLPQLKQGILSYKLTQTTTTYTEVIDQTLTQAEAVQPPTFSEVWNFQGTNQAQLAELVVPTVDLAVSVFPQVTQESLLAGAGMMYADRVPNKDNVVILGHHLGNQNLLFGQLMKAATDEDIYLYFSSTIYHYKITNTEIIKETELNILENTQGPKLTLITCDKPTQTDQRFVVTAELQQQEPENKTTIQRKKQVKKAVKQRNSLSAFLAISGFSCLMVVGALIILRQLREEENE